MTDGKIKKKTLADLKAKAGNEEALAECKAAKAKPGGVAFVTSASAAKMGLTKDQLWDGKVGGITVKNPAFWMALQKIDGDQVMICEDARLGVFYSTPAEMSQLLEGSA